MKGVALHKSCSPFFTHFTEGVMMQSSIRTGRFIALVGMDYSGKTTAANKLREDFPDAVFVREPGGTPLGERLRELIKSDEFENMPTVSRVNLLYAARAELIKQVILPALQAGKLVIADRFEACTFAYQIHGELGIDLKDLLEAQHEACVVLPEAEPDAYFFFDVTPEVAFERAQADANRVADHFDRRGLDFRRRLRHGYIEFFATVHRLNRASIKADLGPDEVYAQVRAEVERVLSLSAPEVMVL